VVELVLEQEIEAPLLEIAEPSPGQIISQVVEVTSPGKGNHLHVVALPEQVFHQLSIVEVAA
jgi:hypothetical protein